MAFNKAQDHLLIIHQWSIEDPALLDTVTQSQKTWFLLTRSFHWDLATAGRLSQSQGENLLKTDWRDAIQNVYDDHTGCGCRKNEIVLRFGNFFGGTLH